ncbi:MAG: ribosomal-processing cysteine protease Prp [Lachnospirales bacterium]
MSSKSSISANIYMTHNRIFSFTVENHGSSFVCAAVSMLVINTINAIDKFLDVKYTLDVDEKNAIIHFESHDTFNGIKNDELDILLNTMVLGLQDTAKNYSEDLTLNIEEVQQC